MAILLEVLKSNLDKILNIAQQFGAKRIRVFGSVARANRIKREQKACRLNVRDKCRTSNCLKKVYRKRVDELSNSYSWD